MCGQCGKCVEQREKAFPRVIIDLGVGQGQDAVFARFDIGKLCRRFVCRRGRRFGLGRLGAPVRFPCFGGRFGFGRLGGAVRRRAVGFVDGRGLCVGIGGCSVIGTAAEQNAEKQAQKEC